MAVFRRAPNCRLAALRLYLGSLVIYFGTLGAPWGTIGAAGRTHADPEPDFQLFFNVLGTPFRKFFGPRWVESCVFLSGLVALLLFAPIFEWTS